LHLNVAVQEQLRAIKRFQHWVVYSSWKLSDEIEDV